ncbi:MAG: hypothetical protein ACR2LK_12405 [Solirubrobacteraceae bacterium]
MPLLYFDIILVLVVAGPALASGAPVLGFTVGGATWILARLASNVAERRIADIGDLRHRLAFGVGFSMLRVWVLAIAIIVAGVAASRPDGLTAALVIFGAFSVRFACSAISHVSRKRGLSE